VKIRVIYKETSDSKERLQRLARLILSKAKQKEEACLSQSVSEK